VDGQLCTAWLKRPNDTDRVSKHCRLGVLGSDFYIASMVARVVKLQ